MTAPIADLSVLLSRMAPELQAGEYVFAMADRLPGLALRDVVASIREPEGLSVVVPASVAGRFGALESDRFAWITLTVHSDLQAVGLTGAFATALGLEGIRCNVLAGWHHDHMFVPVAHADAAVAALRGLQAPEADRAARTTDDQPAS